MSRPYLNEGSKSFESVSRREFEAFTDMFKNRNFSFETALVVDFVSNPESFKEDIVDVPDNDIAKREKVKDSKPSSNRLSLTKLEMYQTGYRVNDISLLETMPQNSIIGYTISEESPEYVVLFPFFPLATISSL